MSHGNEQKHENPSLIQSYLIANFHGQVVNLLRSIEASDILDAGCGEGYTLQALRANHIKGSLTGIDASQQVVDKAKTRVLSAEFVCIDIHDYAIQHDTVLCLEVLEHNAMPDEIMDHLISITGRFAIISVPWEPWFRVLNLLRGKRDDPDHVQHWTRKGFLRFVSGYFDVVAAPVAFPWVLVLVESKREESE